MPRTYLPSTGSGKSRTNVGGDRLGWRPTIQLDDSDEEEEPVRLKSRRKRPPLMPSTQIVSPVFNPGMEDSFDQLFQNINKEKIKAPGRDPLSFSSANTTAQSNHSEDGLGLFQSFSDEPVLFQKKKPTRSYKSGNTKKQERKEKTEKENRQLTEKENRELTPPHSATLLRDLKFSTNISSLQNLNSPSIKARTSDSVFFPQISNKTSPNDLVFPSASKSSIRARTPQTISSPDLFFQTPGPFKTISCLTSTPLLRSVGSQNISLSPSDPNPEIIMENVFLESPDNISGKSKTLGKDEDSKTNKVSGEDVFISVSESSPGKLTVVPASRTKILSSNEIIPATPDKMVTMERGRKKFAGPALSMMGHLKWKVSMKSVNMLSEFNEMSLNSDTGPASCEKKIIRPSSFNKTDSSRLGLKSMSIRSTRNQLEDQSYDPVSIRSNYSQSSQSGPRTGMSTRSQNSNFSDIKSKQEVSENRNQVEYQSKEDVFDESNHSQSSQPESRTGVSTRSQNSNVSDTKSKTKVSKSGSNIIMTRSGSKFSQVSSDTSVGFDNSLQSESEQSYDYRDAMGCVCGEDERGDKTLIRCDRCGLYLHVDCVGFTEEDLDEIERFNPEWFCPYCVEDCKISDSSHSFLENHTSKLNPETEDLHTSIRTDSGSNATPERSSEKETIPVEEFEPKVEQEPQRKYSFQKESFNTQESSILSNPPNHLSDTEEFVVKPGKNWRRSLSSNISRGLNLSQCRRTTMTSFNYSALHTNFEPNKTDFAIPAIPPGRRKSKRLSMSTRRSTMLQIRKSTLPQTLLEGDEDEDTGETMSDDNTVLSSRQVRSSFYIVHDESKDKDKSELPDNSILLQPDLTDIEKLLSKCSNKNVVEFGDVYGEDCMAASKKVGEGAFGEVYLIGASSGENPVLKVVPIGGTVKVNDEEQTSLPDMMSEVVISTSLSNLRFGKLNKTSGFVEVRNCIVFTGEYPSKLLQLWDDFDAEKTSENIRPDYLPVDQLYVSLEFNNGGRDLEKYEFRNATQALSAWVQVVHTLAVAEEALNFEHRDLHWGNILIKESENKTVTFVLDGDQYSVETGGVETTIIDFSLSRLTSEEDKCTIFNNLATDPTLFSAIGQDRGGDYQFDIYRKMRTENRNNWEEFNPKTNIFWLHYILEKMITEVYYKGKKNSKPHKSGLARLRIMKQNLLEFSSARDWVRREGTREA